VALAPDETAPALAAAVAGAVGAPSPPDLLVVPALAALSGDDYLAVVRALGALADRTDAVVLLDPSAVTVPATATGVPPALTALADQVRATVTDPTRVVLYTSSLVDETTGRPVSAAAAAAGLMDVVDAQAGPWRAAVGLSHPLTGLRPALVLSTDEAGVANVANLIPFVPVPGYGTVVWGDRTLARSTWVPPTYLSVRRTMTFLEQSIKTSMQAYVFQANDPTTWAEVDASITSFLTSVWQEGGLQGETAADAFSVEVGLGTTMTGDDILNGLMNVEVQVAITRPAELTVLSFQQEMQTS